MLLTSMNPLPRVVAPRAGPDPLKCFKLSERPAMCQQPRDPGDVSSLALWRVVPPRVGLLPSRPQVSIYRPCLSLRG